MLQLCCVLQVRQTAVSHDTPTILACCEDGTIWRWDSIRPLKPSEEDDLQDEEGTSSDASMQGSEDDD